MLKNEINDCSRKNGPYGAFSDFYDRYGWILIRYNWFGLGWITCGIWYGHYFQ